MKDKLSVFLDEARLEILSRPKAHKTLQEMIRDYKDLKDSKRFKRIQKDSK